MPWKLCDDISNGSGVIVLAEKQTNRQTNSTNQYTNRHYWKQYNPRYVSDNHQADWLIKTGTIEQIAPPPLLRTNHENEHRVDRSDRSGDVLERVLPAGRQRVTEQWRETLVTVVIDLVGHSHELETVTNWCHSHEPAVTSGRSDVTHQWPAPCCCSRCHRLMACQCRDRDTILGRWRCRLQHVLHGVCNCYRSCN